MSANRLRMICSKMFSKKFIFVNSWLIFDFWFLTLFRDKNIIIKFSKPNFKFF